MRNHLLRSFSGLAAILVMPLGACPAGPPAPPPGSGPADLGMLAGKPFVARDAIVVRLPKKKGRGDIAWVALTSAPDACAAYLDGSLELQLFEPRQHYQDAQMIVWTVFPDRDLSGDLKTGPIQHAIPSFEGQSPLPPKEPGPFGFAQAVTSDAECQNHDVKFDYPTLISRFAIDSVGAPGEPLKATFHLAQGQTDLRGSFIARPCQPPPGWRPAETTSCKAAPEGPKKTVEELLGPPGAKRFFPMGEPTGVAGVCWQAELTCIAEQPETARVQSVEVAQAAFRDKLPIADGETWVSHTRKDGNGGSLIRAVRTESDKNVYDLDGDILTVDKKRAADGFFHATYTTQNNVETKSDALICEVPAALGGDRARWRYSSSGACPAP